jgi:hypothetical protein
MTFTDEVYYYVETGALFSDPESLGVRKLGTVASWTATLHRNRKAIACSFRVLLPYDMFVTLVVMMVTVLVFALQCQKRPTTVSKETYYSVKPLSL